MHRIKSISKKQQHIGALFSLVLLYVLWYFISMYIDKNMPYNLVLPNPNSVFKKVANLLMHPETYTILFSSFSRLINALAISFLTAIFAGTTAALNPVFEAFLRPYISSIRAIPVASMLIVILLWIGSANAPTAICAMVVFPLFYEMILGSIHSMEKSFFEVISLDSNFNFFVFRKVFIPSILNNLFISLIQSVGLGFKVLVMSELISYTDKSIGKKIYTSKLNLDIESVFAWTVIIIVIVMMLEWIFRLVKKTGESEQKN